jgi:hypothetical protein
MAKQKAQNGSAPQNQEIPAAAFDEALATWWAPTHLRYERGWLWFALVFLFCGGLA